MRDLAVALPVHESGGAELFIREPLHESPAAVFMKWNDFGAELPEFLNPESDLRPKLPRSDVRYARSSSAPRPRPHRACERPPWDNSPPSRLVRERKEEFETPFTFLSPRELEALVHKERRLVHWAQKRVEKTLGLVRVNLTSAEQRIAEANAVLASSAIRAKERAIKREPRTATEEEHALLGALDYLDRAAFAAQCAMEERETRLSGFTDATKRMLGALDKAASYLKARREDLHGNPMSMRHLPTTTANDEQLFRIQSLTSEASQLAEEARIACSEASDAARTEAARVVKARERIFAAVRAITKTPLLAYNAEGRQAGAGNINDLLRSLSQEEQSISKVENAVLRGRFDCLGGPPQPVPQTHEDAGATRGSDSTHETRGPLRSQPRAASPHEAHDEAVADAGSETTGTSKPYPASHRPRRPGQPRRPTPSASRRSWDTRWDSAERVGSRDTHSEPAGPQRGAAEPSTATGAPASAHAFSAFLAREKMRGTARISDFSVPFQAALD